MRLQRSLKQNNLTACFRASFVVNKLIPFLVAVALVTNFYRVRNLAEVSTFDALSLTAPVADAVTKSLGGEVSGSSIAKNTKAQHSLHSIPITKNDPSAQNSDNLWSILVNHAADFTSAGEGSRPGVAVEVGMHTAKQCIEAAQAGLEAHCFEPSPNSFARVKGRVEQQPPDIQKRLHIYNKAASNTSEGTVDFKSTGGTGDHVGEYDMWSMKKTTAAEDLKGQIVKVQQIRLDDVLTKLEDEIFAIKVDTQGFEPMVFSGLSKSIAEHKIKFILTEYWPRGIDLHAGKNDQCVAADLLSTLADAGYTLYALSVIAHPRAPQGYKGVTSDRPLHDLRENCQWYLDLEKRFPSDSYKMGYWSDVFAVAPNAVSNEEELFSKLQNFGF